MPRRKRKLNPDRVAYSVAEFCEAHRISVPMYGKLRRAGLGPTVMAVGSRRLISIEAAAEWRRAREARQ